MCGATGVPPSRHKTDSVHLVFYSRVVPSDHFFNLGLNQDPVTDLRFSPKLTSCCVNLP